MKKIELIKTIKTYLINYRKTIASAVLLLLAGMMVIAISESMGESFWVREQRNQMAASRAMSGAESPAEATPSEAVEAQASLPLENEEEQETAETVPEELASQVRLNMAYVYPEGTDTENVADSVAGQAFKTLSKKDADWFSGIYSLSGTSPQEMAVRLGRETPPDSILDWSEIRVTFYNGDGKAISGYSNAKEILSMASVYAYWKGIEDQKDFINYTSSLWNASHRYTIQMSEVYECPGCLEEEETTESVASPSEASPEDDTQGLFAAAAAESYSLEDVPEDWESIEGPARDIWAAVVASDKIVEEEETKAVCPGHIDLHISAYIDGLDAKEGLYTHDQIGNRKENADDTWNGWNHLNQLSAQEINQQDWFQTYGLSMSSGVYLWNPLSQAEISSYLQKLPPNTSAERTALIKQALQSVGCIPYYWGGKPSCAGLSGNGFGAVIAPDINGRVLQGLDCSGWINWVYWTALGDRLDFEGTSGLANYRTPIQRADLQPGDIMVKLGESPHVCMFMAWAEDGSMYVIHETGGSTNNVTISRTTSDWPYYRKLVQESGN